MLLETNAESDDEQKQTAEKLECCESFEVKQNEREAILDAYVTEFIDSYEAMHPDRSPLFLLPKDQTGNARFVSSYIVPSLLPVAELQEPMNCSELVSRLLQLEMAHGSQHEMQAPVEGHSTNQVSDSHKEATESKHEVCSKTLETGKVEVERQKIYADGFPKELRTSESVLQSGRGTVFEQSVLLCSLLIGAGYDAFCVCGFATEQLAVIDKDEEDVRKLQTILRKYYPEYWDGLCIEALEHERNATNVTLFENLRKDDDRSEVSALEKEPVQTEAEIPYLLKPKFAMRSEFLESDERAEEEMEDAERAATAQDADTLDASGKATWFPYCLVLVRSGKRNQSPSYLIDPVRSEKVLVSSVSKELFDVQLVFNSKNAFVVLPSGSGIEPDFTEIALFNFNNHEVWETVLADNQKASLSAQRWRNKKAGSSLAVEETRLCVDTHESANSSENQRLALKNSPDGSRKNVSLETAATSNAKLKPFHLPPSSLRPVDALVMKLQGQCSRKKVIEANKLRLELLYPTASPQSDPIGLVSRLTTFEDAAKACVHSIKEVYERRSDFLVGRTLYPSQHLTIESFLPGREDCLKEMLAVPESRRVLVFHTGARRDALLTHAEDFKRNSILLRYQSEDKTEERVQIQPAVIQMEVFLGRKLAAQRSKAVHAKRASLNVNVNQDMKSYLLSASLQREDLGDCEIVSIKEVLAPECHSNESERKIQSVLYHIADGIIQLIFQRQPGQILQPKVRLAKWKASTESVDSAEVDQVDSEVNPSREMITKWAKRETGSYQRLREVERLMQQIISTRREEDKTVVLVPSYIQLAESQQRRRRERARQKRIAKESKRGGIEQDYSDALDLYLPHGSFLVLPNAELLQARESCLEDYKQRLLRRAAIIEDKLLNEKTRLETRKAAFERSKEQNDSSKDQTAREGKIDFSNGLGSTGGVEGEFERFRLQAEFKIQVLETRLQQHEEGSVERFKRFEAKLRRDPRLAGLYRR